jgi:hypothetical protein
MNDIFDCEVSGVFGADAVIRALQILMNNSTGMELEDAKEWRANRDETIVVFGFQPRNGELEQKDYPLKMGMLERVPGGHRVRCWDLPDMEARLTSWGEVVFTSPHNPDWVAVVAPR